MPKITIVPEDGMVLVDGVFRGDMNLSVDPNIHAIHWDGTKGVIEYKDKPEEDIDDITPYMPLVAQQAAEIQTETDEAATIAAEREAELEAIIAAAFEANEAVRGIPLSATVKRRAEYPSLIRHLEALYADRQGDPSKLATFDTEMAVVDTKYPL